MNQAETRIEALESLIAAQSRVLDLIAANSPMDVIMGELEARSISHSIGESEPWIQAQFERLGEIAVERHMFQTEVSEMLADERRRLAEALHDDPIQAITSIGLRLQRLSRGASNEQQEQILDIQRNVSSTVDRMRQMLFDLHPPTLDDEGLDAAVELFLFERLDPEEISWQLDSSSLGELAPAIRSLAYRLVREALTNVVRHANASAVTVVLTSDDVAMMAKVTDDGDGFDPAILNTPRAGHMGASNSRNLARRAAGEWTITSELGRGSTVLIQLPMGRLGSSDRLTKS